MRCSNSLLQRPARCQPRVSLPEYEVDNLPGQRVLDVPIVPHLAALAACAVVLRRRILENGSDM